MRLRPFKKCDAEEIVSWIDNEHIFPIGVFENNPSALNCYLKSGFKDTGITDTYPISGEKWICRELVFEPIAANEEG